MVAELAYDQFRAHTPARVMGWDDAGDPVLVSVFGGATSLLDGTWGFVPMPEAGDQDKFLKGDGTWADPADVLFNNTSAEFDIPVTDGVGDIVPSGIFS